ncbi:Rv1733c family protein [Streptomyces poriticola]|uniref:Rv1733c family protein n=1 Tax=Streptomyces poriticola TaxID=3120506 RepID=UPI002FCE5A56
MSGQDSPHASGPRPPREPHGQRGPNPLRRPSDRFEEWFRRALYLVLVLGLPAAALGAGQNAYESSMRTAQSQAAERQEVTARLTSQAGDGGRGAQQPAEVRWTDAHGTVRTGTAVVEAGTDKGASVQVWVDRQGTVTGPPMTASEARTAGWFTGGMAAIGVVAGVHAARSGVRLVLDRRRYAQWEAEWDRVEPLWSARFGR